MVNQYYPSFQGQIANSFLGYSLYVHCELLFSIVHNGSILGRQLLCPRARYILVSLHAISAALVADISF